MGQSSHGSEWSVQKAIKPSLLERTTLKSIATKATHPRKKGVIIIGAGIKGSVCRSQQNRNWLYWRIAELSFPRRRIIYRGGLSEK